MDINRQVGQRIRMARESAGLTQEELGKLVGRIGGEPYSGAAISYFETGHRKVKLSDLPFFAKALNKPFSYFLAVDGIGASPERSHRSAPLSAILLRATPYLNPEATAQIQGFYAHVVDLPPIERTYDFDEEDLRRPDSLLGILGYSHPPIDPVHVSREVGIHIIEWDFDDSISGVLVMDGDHRAIGVNKHHPLARQRYSMAHELGHFCLGHKPLFDVSLLDSMSERPNTVYERQANAFAAELLMPRHMVHRAFNKYGENLPALSNEFRVSPQAMWIRLLELGLANKETWVPF